MATRSQFDLKIGIRLVAVPLATATATATATLLKIQLWTYEKLHRKVENQGAVFSEILWYTQTPTSRSLVYSFYNE